MASLTVFLQSPQAKYNIQMLVDTETGISLIKLSTLVNTQNFDKNDIIRMRDITNQRINSLGSIQLKLALSHLNLEHKFFAVSDDFPIPYSGILGKEFLKRYHCLIDYDQMTLTIRPSKRLPVSLQIRNEVLPRISVGAPRG